MTITIQNLHIELADGTSLFQCMKLTNAKTPAVWLDGCSITSNGGVPFIDIPGDAYCWRITNNHFQNTGPPHECAIESGGTDDVVFP